MESNLYTHTMLLWMGVNLIVTPALAVLSIGTPQHNPDWTVTMSTVLNYGGLWNKSNAIDNVINTTQPDICLCCAGTRKADNNWLQVDFGSQSTISTILVYGRTDEGNNYNGLYIYLEQHSSHMGTTPVKRVTSNLNFIETSVEPARSSQFVTIILTKNDFLIVCELQVLRCPAGLYGTNCDIRCNCLNNKTCIDNGLCPNNECATGWDGPSCDRRANLALNKPVTMSSTFLDWNGSRATDANTSTDADDCQCCAATQEENRPSLRIDLGASLKISTIVIYGRTYTSDSSQYFNGMEVYLHQMVSQDGPNVNNQTFTSKHVVNITFDKEQTAHYVTIVLPGTKLLVVCDVQIRGGIECDNGWFGFACQDQCFCKGDTCNTANGICPSNECLPGYKLDTCSKPCDYGYFGINCGSSCGHCKHSDTCHHVNGHCINGCSDGYEAPFCNQECSPGHYGENCQTECGHCSSNSPCHHINGHCNECAPGYKGLLCFEKCNDDTFGDKCNSTCGHCKGLVSCNNVNGTCPSGCQPGYEAPTCKSECSYGYYGENCHENCGYCYNAITCNHFNGTCIECAPGYKGQTCEEKCDEGTFGDNCNSTCGQCKGTCNTINGTCMNGCKPGYEAPSCKSECIYGPFGENCEEACGYCSNNSTGNHINGNCTECEGLIELESNQKCAYRFYGGNCEKTCGHCNNNETCNHIDGNCNVCALGYKGDLCQTACDNLTFGLNCNSRCGKCKDAQPCDSVTGHCPAECDSNYKGLYCVTEAKQSSDVDDSSSTSLIAGAISAAVVVLIVGVIVAFLYTKRKCMFARNGQAKGESRQFTSIDKDETSKTTPKPSQRSSLPASKAIPKAKPSSVIEPKSEEFPTSDYYSFTPRKDDIKIYQIWDFIKSKMTDSCKMFNDEFGSLHNGLALEHKVAMKPENKVKNRYREMYAYDHSRVPLIAHLEGESEYINACFIDGFDKPAKFIASQGPTKFMIDDFWRMVWQQRSNTIIMLTNIVEMGTEKCMQYWPTEGSKKFENINVKLMKEETCLDYVVRHLQVKENEDDYRTVTQYHFKSWPDKDVPDSSWCLVNFWRNVCADKTVHGPLVVHCSAGVGRTGTFIALDNIYNQALVEGNVRPLQIVEALRRQRVNMVQTREQYVYLHEAVADALYFGTHFIWTKQFEDMFRFMKQTDSISSISRLETQYNLICESIEKREVQEENEYSNVDTISTEMDAYRPKSMNCNKGIDEGIKAVCLPNSSGLDAFVVTDTPRHNSCADFWRLIEDQNIKTIITITSDTTAKNNVMRYIGSNGSPTVGKFDVNALDEKKRSSFIERNFTFKESNKDIDELTTVKMFEFSAWHDNEETAGDNQSVLDLLDAVYRWQPQSTDKQPILVYSGEGINKSGVVCVLMNELHRMRQNGGQINIVETVKTMKQRDRDLIANFEQYRYCHDVILHHINQTEVYQNI